MSRFFNGFDSNVFLAPMAGITDKPMRRLVSSMGPGTMVSEMVAINAISRKNPKSYRIADVRDEPYKVVVQLVGGNEGLFARFRASGGRTRRSFRRYQHGLSGQKNRQQPFRFMADERHASSFQNP